MISTKTGPFLLTLVVLGGLCLSVFSAFSIAGERAYVRYVIDGDTIILQNGIKVRYRGINAPEIPHGDKPGEPFGWDATSRNRALVQGRTVKLVQDDDKIDRFGRLLAYVFLHDGRMVNEILVREGLAFVCFSHKGSSFNKRLLAAQKEAIDAKRGMWSLPPLNPESYYIGNSRSLRFHRPSCPYGKKIGLPNRVYFKSRLDAYKEGYCRCKKCVP